MCFFYHFDQVLHTVIGSEYSVHYQNLFVAVATMREQKNKQKHSSNHLNFFLKQNSLITRFVAYQRQYNYYQEDRLIC